MDGPADRVDLRGLGLLERCRTLRRDDAERDLARARRELEAAALAEHEAAKRLQQHRETWRTREHEILAGMTGRVLDGIRFRAARDELDRLAGTAVRLQGELEGEARTVAEASARVDAARLRFAERRRRLQQSEAVTARVVGVRAVGAAAMEEQALDDDLALRHGRARR